MADAGWSCRYEVASVIFTQRFRISFADVGHHLEVGLYNRLAKLTVMLPGDD
jgi:hypothetical protein